ncbi:MAG: hypothetical protein WC897_03005 [Candidatus Gracilibacteria bacterium]
MKSLMQILATFGILSLMLAGCSLTGEETTVEDASDAVVTDDVVVPAVDDTATTPVVEE